MTQPDNTKHIYALVDKWIEIILTNKPELVVKPLFPIASEANGQPEAFDINGAINSARALAEFRLQLGNSLSAQYFSSSDE